MSDKSKTSDKSNFDKLVEGGDIFLNCLIPDEDVNNIFGVPISNANNNRVSSLVEAIRNCHLDRFQDIDPTSLALYKVRFVADSVLIQTLRNNNNFIHFPTQPQPIYSGEKGINVIVYSLTETVPEVLSKDN
ncbi:hypothetical protein C1645_797682 [Glomus cerebriforme]|uniref:Crinkler effector protein N-terminal domain-containing protein n=1 Tax=Glomus cerebriforme TaxID=658196 RepID=A0A397SHF0_9GLOM|nr:hypothetical protein C1645_797682 [Glomus cerebriforme]